MDKTKRLSSEEFVQAIERSPDKWLEIERALWQASEVLDKQVRRGSRKLNSLIRQSSTSFVSEMDQHQQTTFFEAQDQLSLSRVTPMLRAMSIECMLKAAYYRSELREKGHVKHVTLYHGNHDLVLLAETVGLQIDEELRSRLRYWSTMNQLGRYPVTKSKCVNFGSDPKSDADVREELKCAITLLESKVDTKKID